MKIQITTSVPIEHANTGVSDDDYDPEEMYIKRDKLESSRCIAENIAECLEANPIIQLKRKRVEHVSESTEKYHRKKLIIITCSLLGINLQKEQHLGKNKILWQRLICHL